MALFFNFGVIFLIFLNMEKRVVKEQELYLAKLKELGFYKSPKKKRKRSPKKKKVVAVKEEEIIIEI